MGWDFDIALVATEKDAHGYYNGTGGFWSAIRLEKKTLSHFRAYLHEGDQIRQPEGVLCLDIDGNEGRKSSHIHSPVEPHEEFLHREFRVDDDPFSSLESLEHRSGILILLCTHRSDICFDAARAEANCDHGGDESSESGTIPECRWRRSRDEDDETDNVDTGGYEDCLELSEILIGDNGSNDCRSISPELEEVPKSCSNGLALTERSGQLSSREGVRIVDVVLYGPAETEVREAFAELNGQDE